MKPNLHQGLLLFVVVYTLLKVLEDGAQATSWRRVQKDCPLCRSKVEGMVPGSTFIGKVDADFRPKGVGVDMTSASILMCDKCGFAAISERFDDTKGLDPNRVRLELATVKSPRLFRELDHAAVVERQWNNDLLLLARFSLAAKWLADDTGEVHLINQRLAAAIQAHLAALKQPKLSKADEAIITYLVGELNRQAGNQLLALQWLKKAEKIVPPEHTDLVRQQMALLGNQDQRRMSLPELRKATDAQKLSAIAHLRELNNRETIGFLTEYCLNCPDRFREHAIEILVADEPKSYHLPIFLAGLRNENFRTVQWSAEAVERLQAPEAAAIIVEVLKQPKDFTVFRLTAALGGTATSNEVDYLISRLNQEAHPHLLFNALVQTQTPRAIPHILSLLNREPSLARLYDEKDFRRAARFVELLRALPDLSQANPESPLAIFKAHALRSASMPEAEKQLLSALDRGGELGSVAALMLAFRGNGAGKRVLVENIEDLMSLDDQSLTNLYRYLEPIDFKVLSSKMVECKTRELEGTKFRRESLEEQLSSPDLPLVEKQVLKRELDRLIWDENRFCHRWIEVLAATRSAEARPFCEALLKSPNAQYRAKAVTSLGWLFDDSIGAVLAAGLADESDMVKEAAYLVFAKVGDEKYAELIIASIKEPSLVSTKRAWMQAMNRLAPEKAESIVKQWLNSPNKELATIANQFVSAPNDTFKR